MDTGAREGLDGSCIVHRVSSLHFQLEMARRGGGMTLRVARGVHGVLAYALDKAAEPCVCRNSCLGLALHGVDTEHSVVLDTVGSFVSPSGCPESGF